MAYLFADENFPLPVVQRLQELGHVVMTLQEAGKANLSLPDTEVLALALEHGSALLTLNRRHFIRLHTAGRPHKGVIVCSFDPNFEGLAERIDRTLANEKDLTGKLIRIHRPG